MVCRDSRRRGCVPAVLNWNDVDSSVGRVNTASWHRVGWRECGRLLMDSELQKALDIVTKAQDDGATLDDEYEYGAVMVLVKAARKVDNLDIGAAVAVMWDREPYLEPKEENMKRAVRAALGITEDT